MTTVLVTGGAGYIGSHTCKTLSDNGVECVTFDNLSRGHAESVLWGPLVVGDILDPIVLEEAFERYHPDAVIHFAALAYVGESFTAPLLYYNINVTGLINVVNAMVKSSTRRILFSSSCATYGIPDVVPISEDAPQSPISPYGRSKLACEQILKDAASCHGIDFGILRYFNVGGAARSGELVERHSPETHLIPLTIDAAIGQGPPLQINGVDYPTVDGTCERDFIHVSDLAMAHGQALARLQQTRRSFEVNLGSGRVHSVHQVISMVKHIIGRNVPVEFGPRRPGDPPTLYSDISLARCLLDFNPLYSDLETIVETAWYSRR